MIRFLQVIGILLLLLSIALGPAAAAPNLQLQLLLPQNTAQFKYYTMAPGAVAVGPQNASGQQNIYVADAGFDSILKFDANGNLLSQWGGPGTGNGQFGEPRGLAADAWGHVYVTDWEKYWLHLEVRPQRPSGGYLGDRHITL